jgi:alcohol dehydrogenase class IV
VTDPVLAGLGLADRVAGLILAAGAAVTVFDQGRAEPALHLVASAAREAAVANPDVVVGLGGGSNMDVAKFVAVLLAHGGRPHDYLGDGKIPGPTAPVVCIPTTAGTGSEVTGAAAFTDTDRAVKVGSLSNWLRPAVALVDPDLTVTCPPKVTADSGIDALTHAVEAFTAVDFPEFPLPPGERSVYQGRNPMTDLFAARAIELVGMHLTHAVRDGRDRAARDGMMLASTLAGLAFSNSGVALVHALEYPVGGATNCSHGEGNGLLLPHVMRFNLPARRQEFARMSRWLGGDGTAESAVAAVETMQETIRCPRRLRDLRVREDQLPDFADKAHALQRMLRVNPRSVSVDDCLAIYRAAY